MHTSNIILTEQVVFIYLVMCLYILIINIIIIYYTYIIKEIEAINLRGCLRRFGGDKRNGKTDIIIYFKKFKVSVFSLSVFCFWCLCQESGGSTWIDLFLGPQLYATIQLTSVSIVPAHSTFYYCDSGV